MLSLKTNVAKRKKVMNLKKMETCQFLNKVPLLSSWGIRERKFDQYKSFTWENALSHSFFPSFLLCFFYVLRPNFSNGGSSSQNC